MLPAACVRRSSLDVGLHSPKAGSTTDEVAGATMIAGMDTVQNAIEPEGSRDGRKDWAASTPLHLYSDGNDCVEWSPKILTYSDLPTSVTEPQSRITRKLFRLETRDKQFRPVTLHTGQCSPQPCQVQEPDHPLISSAGSICWLHGCDSRDLVMTANSDFFHFSLVLKSLRTTSEETIDAGTHGRTDHRHAPTHSI